MTNEEIERAARATVAAHIFLWVGSETGGSPQACRAAAIEVLAKLMREAVSQAYEEAAQIAIDHREGSLEGCGEDGCGGTIASEIRALKDSLVGEGG